MNGVESCPKCGGAMREGDLVVKVVEGEAKPSPFMSAMMMRTGDIASNLGMLPQETISVEGPLWQEQSEKEGGWLFKKKETRVLQIKGKRCEKCGYIELYTKEG